MKKEKTTINNIKCPKCKSENCFIFEKSNFVNIVCDNCNFNGDYLKND